MTITDHWGDLMAALQWGLQDSWNGTCTRAGSVRTPGNGLRLESKALIRK